MKRILIGILIYFFYSCHFSAEQRDVLENTIDSLSEENRNLKTSLRLSSYLTGREISRRISVVNTSFDTIPIKSLFGIKKRLFFQYSDLDCDLCLQSQIQMLKNYSDTCGQADICIIACVSSFRSISSLIRTVGTKITCVQLPKYESIIENTEFIKEPFYFITDSSMKLDFFFWPPKGDSISSQIFFQNLMAKLDRDTGFRMTSPGSDSAKKIFGKGIHPGKH